MLTESGAAKRSSVLKGFLDRLRSAVARWNEFQRMDSRQMGAIARELNLSTAELCALTVQPSGTFGPLSRRLSHAGLSEEQLVTAHGGVFRDMTRVCSQCHSKARCARDLRHKRWATPAKYCPNEQTLRALADKVKQDAAQIPPCPASCN